MILFAGFVLMCAAIYYLDGVMSLLLKLGENFHLVAIWVVGGFAVAGWSAMWSGRGCTTKPSRWKPNTRSATKSGTYRHGHPRYQARADHGTAHVAPGPRRPARSLPPAVDVDASAALPSAEEVRRIPPKRPWM